MIKGKKATEWYIAGGDQKFYPAEVKIVRGNIQVSSKQVTAPVAVRFAFSNDAIGNLFSKDGLPLNPFRTDDWEMDTDKN